MFITIVGVGLTYDNGWSHKPAMQDPNEDTEWNDLLRSKGILPPKEEVTLEEDTVVQVNASNLVIITI